MNMKVIVPLDFSPTSMRALKAGVEIANKIKADIRVIYVEPESTVAKGYEQTILREEADINQVLENIVGETQKEYYVEKGRFDYVIRKGNVSQEIINQSKYDNATMIVMGSHGVSGIATSWIGGNTYRVISNVSCPVLVIRHDMVYDQNFRRIAITLTSKKSSRYKVPTVAGLAKVLGASISLLGIQRTNMEAIFRSISLAIHQVEAYLKKHNIEVERTSTMRGKDFEPKLLESLNMLKADMVAIDITNTGAFLADRFRPFLINLINNSACPVLTIPIDDTKNIVR
ncbi:MAG: universal stress protein [Marinilabiliaceae bacterium]|nr:universal stress protein [Marinilabiliaceae bacterium]